ncbi:hypothetical protein [Chitinophaga deserti]|uniref:hypothetical protein n=1 Tax=Chitinophaga deserti TaxID=2164099 RepID=UPI000D6D805E|nr:hypothetical protein [Chitinophaga deserti]
MRQLTKWISFLLILVVVCASAGGSSFASEPADSCCQHDQPSDDPCSDEQEEEKGCSNEGNPFQFCSCCIHAWVTTQEISLGNAPHPAPTNYQFCGNAFLPTPPASDFWQPPRIS